MTKFKKTIPAKQQMMLPPTIDELVKEDHIARLISDIVDELNTSKIENKYGDRGAPPYHPKIMLKILFYGYSVGLRGSRKLENKCHEDIIFIYLTGWQKPDFKTICDFRRNNCDEIKDLFVQLVRICKKIGVLKLGSLNLDGTKIKANASAKRTKTMEKLEKLEKDIKEEIEKILEEAEKVDKKEENKNRENGTGKELDKNLAKQNKRLKKIREAKSYLERQEEELTKVNITEPESREMKERKGVIRPNHNCQIVTDESNMIVAYDVVQDRNDTHQLAPMVEQANENLEEEVEKVKADTGYGTYDNYEYLTKKGIDGYVPDPCVHLIRSGKINEEKYRFHRANFVYDGKKNRYICPLGKYLDFVPKTRGERLLNVYRCAECPGCEFKDKCCPKTKHKELKVDKREPLRLQMREKLLTPEGYNTYKERMYMVEGKFGHQKQNLGYRNFLLRGTKFVNGEYGLICIGTNFKRLQNLLFEKGVRFKDLVKACLKSGIREELKVA